MITPLTLDQFLELARKSGLLDSKHLEAYRESERRVCAVPDAPRALAETLVRDGLLTPFQAERLLCGQWRNFILSGKYKVLRPLGWGGMADVFLCEHLVMRRPVAVKVLPSRSSDPVALERFRREARAVARLRHANIVGAHDIDQDGELHFLVMEYIDGSNLRTVINEQGRMDPLWAAHYIRQAALGLQHAHEAGLVHRDIKPSNLLLDRTGTVKILDLGLARFFNDDSDDLSVLGGPGPVGTSHYMAPEQAVNSHQVDIRADVYGLGATFYFLLAGRSPSRQGTLRQNRISHQLNRPNPIKEIRPEIPDGLAAVLDRMIAREPGERYQTPAEVAEALAPWTESLPAPPTELPEREEAGAGTGHAEAVAASSSFLFASASSPVPWPEVESETAPSRDADRPTRRAAQRLRLLHPDRTATQSFAPAIAG